MATCALCKAEVDEQALTRPKTAAAAFALLKDWRVWAVAFASTVGGGLASAALGIHAIGAGSGAITGVYIGIRSQKMRSCPACHKVSHFPAAPPLKPPTKA